jgi:hypothetical protein
MQNQNQFVHQAAAVLMACGLIASLLPGFAAADKSDNQWSPGYRITDHGLRIDGIRAENPTNRVIYDNDFYFDAMDFAYLAAEDKLGRVDFKGFIVTRNSHMGVEDGYAPVRMETCCSASRRRGAESPKGARTSVSVGGRACNRNGTALSPHPP